ncbi:MAG: mercuric transport protein MerTP [Altibacter sp.]|uniref:mercuric transport protein MerTP n=1 Tax=Altibacter sp. TaxID=2024823 RepID=UPI001D5D5A9D|nr:mercuric transport protein MerTP [Altibacter sp.]MBZ0326321.1 mercuric transport protein MerTP [Altibacter sp.]
MSSEKKLAGTTMITAIAASLCCITPVLALIAGTSGMAATFSWLEPFRPFLIGLTIIVLAFAWYQRLKPKKQDIDCACEDEKPNFFNSKRFLVFVTLFAALMLAFPYYAQVFYPSNSKEVVMVLESNTETISYKIKGMTCTGCEAHIESEVNKLNGIVEATANYETGTATVTFDKTKVSPAEIEVAIRKTGYKIID